VKDGDRELLNRFQVYSAAHDAKIMTMHIMTIDVLCMLSQLSA